MPLHSSIFEDQVVAARARMLQISETLGDDYQNAAAPVVQEQLAKAGIRLAALLNSIWH